LLRLVASIGSFEEGKCSRWRLAHLNALDAWLCFDEKLAAPLLGDMDPDATLRELIIRATDDRSKLLEILLNVALVHHGARSAFLLETANFMAEVTPTECAKYARTVAKSLGLTVTKDSTGTDEFPRYFITKMPIALGKLTENEIADLLGFVCVGHRFDDETLERTAFTTRELRTGCSLTAEVCESEKVDMDAVVEIYHRRVAQWNKVVKMYDPRLEITWSVEEITSKADRLERLMSGDIDYVMSNAGDFLTDLENGFAPCVLADALRDGDVTFIRENLMALRMVYAGFCALTTDDFARRYRKDPGKAEKRLCEFEDRLLSLIEEYSDVSN
jgi:hypothetical protein